jgi:hypothetical protein
LGASPVTGGALTSAKCKGFPIGANGLLEALCSWLSFAERNERHAEVVLGLGPTEGYAFTSTYSKHFPINSDGFL